MKNLMTICLVVLALCLCGSVEAATLNVPGDYGTIQDAIDAAADWDTVLVAEGTYIENITLKTRLSVISAAGPSSTIIDGGGGGPVVTSINCDANTIFLEGFTITNGSAALGGGMYNENSGQIVTNCIFIGNVATQGGGGMCNTNSQMIVTGCTFSDNTATDYYGGGVFNEDSDTTITNCTFSGNSAGLRGGGMFNFSSSPTVTGCGFIGNTAAYGGGMYNYDGSSTITNCTFSGNSTIRHGGGMYNSYSNPTVTNCVIWGNTAVDGDEIYNLDDYSIPIIGFSDIAGCGGSGGGWNSILGIDGGDNIEEDPLFVSAPSDLHLLSGSPCIDAGDNSAIPSGVTTDLDGNPRIVNAVVDMGAFEVQSDECPEFRVNTETTSNQEYPTVAMDADGDFVVAWQSLGQDGDSYGIYAQRYNSDGTPAGDEFQVNTQWADPQKNPSVAVDADGDFVIAWASDVGAYSGDICARRYNSDGTPKGDEFSVATEISDSQSTPSVAMDAAGNFVVAWDFYNGIKARKYNSDGTPGDIFQVNNNYSYWSVDFPPSVAMDADGDFVVAWIATELLTSSEPKWDLKARRFESDGTPAEEEFDVVSSTGEFAPSVAMDENGNFVITWHGGGIYARIFSYDGAPAGPAFRVNTDTIGGFPSVAMDADGDFVIAWQGWGQDGDGYGIYCQWYSSDGTAVGGEFQVNTYIVDDQEHPCVAMDADGNSVIAWQSYGQDGDSYGIYARMFSAGAGGGVKKLRLVLDYASDAISGLIIEQPEVFINDVVMYRLEATIQEVSELLVLRAAGGPYEEALRILKKKVLPKMDGCAVLGSPENGDWIITCEAQGQVYPSIVEAIELLEELVGE